MADVDLSDDPILITFLVVSVIAGPVVGALVALVVFLSMTADSALGD